MEEPGGIKVMVMDKQKNKTNLQLRERIRELEQIERSLMLDIRQYKEIIKNMEKHIEKIKGGNENE